MIGLNIKNGNSMNKTKILEVIKNSEWYCQSTKLFDSKSLKEMVNEMAIELLNCLNKY